jgi:hypothetical protein
VAIASRTTRADRVAAYRVVELLVMAVPAGESGTG